MHLVKCGRTNGLGNRAHRAEDELVKHPGYEESPVDVQQLQNHQHHVEEVVSKEGRVVVQRVHPGTVDQPRPHTCVFMRQSGHVSQIWPLPLDLLLPEREDDNSGNHKDDGKNHKDAISSLIPFGVVQYLGTLRNKNKKHSAAVAVTIVL